MNIVIALDKNFLKPVCVLLTSIEFFETGNTYYLISADLGAADLKILSKCILSESKIILKKIDETFFSKCPIRKNDHVTLAAMMKMLYPAYHTLDCESAILRIKDAE